MNCTQCKHAMETEASNPKNGRDIEAIAGKKKSLRFRSHKTQVLQNSRRIRRNQTRLTPRSNFSILMDPLIRGKITIWRASSSWMKPKKNIREKSTGRNLSIKSLRLALPSDIYKKQDNWLK